MTKKDLHTTQQQQSCFNNPTFTGTHLLTSTECRAELEPNCVVFYSHPPKCQAGLISLKFTAPASVVPTKPGGHQTYLASRSRKLFCDVLGT